MKAVRNSRPWREAGLYLALTVMVSAIFYAFIIATGHVGGGNGVYELGLMWSPAAAALLACRLSGTSIQSLGWKWGATRWQVLAFVIPLGYTAVAYAIVWLTGLGTFPDAKFIDSTRASLGWTGAPEWLVVGGYMARLRLVSGSLWTAALFHASHNQFIQVFFTPLTRSRGAITPYAIDEFGFVLPAVVLLVAVFFWNRGQREEVAEMVGQS